MADAPTQFKDSYPQFSACFQIAGTTGYFGLLDTSKPLGQQRVDVQALRCLAITEIRSDVNARVLDLPNFYDCRIENPAEITELINEAIKAAGGTGDAGFLDEMLSSIDDELEGGGNSGLGVISNIINKIRTGWPRQGVGVDRQFLEDSVKLSFQLANVIADIVQKSFPLVEKYRGDVQKILYILIDTLFFIGDYVAEIGAIRKELGVRVLSKKRVDVISAAFKNTYGSQPSMATVAKWCAYGQQQGDALTAPDGTTGLYDRDLSSWRATQQTILYLLDPSNAPPKYGVPNLRGVFSDVIRRYLVCNAILSAWYGAYSKDEVGVLIEGMKEYATKGPGIFGSNYVMSQVEATLAPTPTADGCGNPHAAENAASTLRLPDPKAIVCHTNYWIPFWEDRIINYNITPNTDNVSPAQRIAYKNSMITALAGTYFSIVQKSYKGTSYSDISNQWKTQDFAAHMKAVIESWEAWAQIAFPSMGKKKRAKQVQAKLISIWPALNSVITSASAATNWNYLLPFPTPNADAAWFNAINFVFNGATQPVPLPEPTSPKYQGVRAMCPGGPNDMSCLPGSSILGNRRPIGAKPVQIPLYLEWGGQQGPLRSPEFAAWAQALTDAGYPGYYINFIAQQVAFVAKPGARMSPPPARSVIDKSGAKAVTELVGGGKGLIEQTTAGGALRQDIKKTIGLKGIEDAQELLRRARQTSRQSGVITINGGWSIRR